MECLSEAVSALGGGFIFKVIDLYRNSGKLELKDYNVDIAYFHDDKMKLMQSMRLNLQFVNTSGRQKIITNFTFKYFDGEKLIDLFTLNHTLKPTELIPERNVKSIGFDLVENPNALYHLVKPINGNCYFIVNYNVGNNTKTVRITNINLVPIKPTRQRNSDESFWQ